MTTNPWASFALVLAAVTSACSSDSGSNVEPSPFDGDYSCTEFLQTCAEKDLQGSIEYAASVETAAGHLYWLEMGCYISHDRVGTEATLIGTHICKPDFVATLTITTLESRLTFASDASEVFWYAHQIDSDGCDLFHNATCTRRP